MRTDRWLVVLIVVVVVIAAAVFVTKLQRRPGSAGEHVASETGALSVLVIGVHGLDLDFVERLSAEGRLPNLTRLMSEGTLAEFETLGKSVDPKIAWTSLVTGVSPENQGIGGKKVTARGTLVDAPLIPKSRTVGTLWTALSDAGRPVGVLGWWGTWPVEQVNGVMVAPYITYYLERRHAGDPSRQLHPVELLGAVDPLIVDPETYSRQDLSRFVNTEAGLGMEALIGQGYKELAKARAADTSMRDVAKLLTADPGVEAEFVLLAGLEYVCQIFWLMAHPDQVDWDYLTELTEEQLRKQMPALGDIIDRYYESVDEIVGDLLELAGDGATVAVVSDHGYDRMRYGADRQPLLGHHMFDERGFWIMAGPGVEKGKRIEGLELLDFAPTLAAAAGIELGQDVEGEVAREALIE